MSRNFEELDFRPTPMGDLILRRRLMPALDNREVHEVILGDAFLMSDVFTEVEQAVSTLGLAELDEPGEPGKPGDESWDVVVGGLGLGFTAWKALANPRVASMLVVDTMQAVIDWHEQGLVPLGKELCADPRCIFRHGDFFALAADPATGFDVEWPGRKFHAIFLDIDHSPRHLLDPSHAVFYSEAGLGKLAEQLHPGGVFSLWSDDAPDEEFLADLAKVFPNARAEIVSFWNPLRENESESTVYLAKR